MTIKNFHHRRDLEFIVALKLTYVIIITYSMKFLLLNSYLVLKIHITYYGFYIEIYDYGSK